MGIALTITILANVATVLTLLWQVYERQVLDRKHYALEMLRQWNENTATHRMTVEKAFDGIYDKCERLTPDKIQNMDGNTKDAVIRLLNFFEFVSAAYLRDAVDKDIVHQSFALTMVRFYCVLGPYIEHVCTTLRANLWEPYTRFVQTICAEQLLEDRADFQCLKWVHDDWSSHCHFACSKAEAPPRTRAAVTTLVRPGMPLGQFTRTGDS